MIDHWDITDIYKALLALAAGIILGLEREMKDKAAGLKTITVISLGAALFAILSYKVGGEGNHTQIAAYIVSGVGFLGAGVIFKDGMTVSGLTTAGIIWLAAAVGTSIGFGEFYLAATFMAASLFIIFVPPYISILSKGKKQTRQLIFTYKRNNNGFKETLFEGLRDMKIFIEEKKVSVSNDLVEVTADLSYVAAEHENIISFLNLQKEIQSFSI